MGAGSHRQFFVSFEHPDELTSSVESIDEGPSVVSHN
jgi:hypothetical protein